MNEGILISTLIVAALLVIGLIIALIVFKKKKEGKIGEPNYKVFHFLGIIWIATGIVFMVSINFVLGIAFMGMGLSYMIIGLANMDKWEKNN